MEDRDPIKQLQHLLDDPGKVLEKISRIQSALAAVNTRTPSAEGPSASLSPSRTESIPQTGVDTYGALLQMIRDLQAQIQECLRPLAQQAVEAEVERLMWWIEREQRALAECLARIDRNLLACMELIRESQRKHTDLSALKKRLEDLGASPSSLPELSMSRDSGEILKDRLESLCRDGKF